MNEFLIDLHFCHPSLVSSLKLPPLSCSISPFPSLSLRIPPYLSEQGESDCCEPQKDRKEGKEKRKEANQKSRNRKDVLGTVLERTHGQSFHASDLLFPVPCWSVFESSGTCGYFGLSVSEWFGMDAITLQEKLVERLLCPRVRTARQKVINK